MKQPVDLILSSGFLAFASQAGFLAGIEDLGIEVRAVCGTSSGSMAAALWCAGMPAAKVLARLTERAPLRTLRPHSRPWQGLLSMKPVISELSSDLPADFSGLDRPFGVGLIDAQGQHHLRTHGPLAASVAASCAIPTLFSPVVLDGVPWADGGVADRTALSAWRALRPDTQPVLHLVERSRGAPVQDDLSALPVIRSPRSGAKLWGLGDVRAAFERTRQETRAQLEALAG